MRSKLRVPLLLILLLLPVRGSWGESYTLTLVPGFNAVANQLSQPDQTVATLIPSPPINTKLFTWTPNPGVWSVNSYSAKGGHWVFPTQTLSIGQGAIIQIPVGSTNFLLTFSGTRLTPTLPLNLVTGLYYFVSSQTPDPGTWESIVGLPPQCGNVLWRFQAGVYNTASGSPPGLLPASPWAPYTYCDGDGWNPQIPMTQVGEPVFVVAMPPVPLITIPPQSQSAAVGQSVSFSVGAIGAPTLGYQWQHNGAPAAGYTDTTLTITNAQTNDVGLYTAVVTNSYGAVTSSPAVLTLTTEISGPGSAPILFTNLNFMSGRFQFSFPGLSGVIYLIEAKDSLDQTNWVTVASLVGSGDAVTLVDPNALGQHRYYRVRQFSPVPWDPPGPATNVAGRYLAPLFDTYVGNSPPGSCGCQSPAGPNSGRGGCQNQGSCDGNVQIQTGELEWRYVDLDIPGRGFNFRFERVYRSGMDYDGPLGFRWEFNYNRRLFVETNGNVLRMDGNARSDRYLLSNGAYQAPSGFYTSLTQNADGTFTERDQHGQVFLYAQTNAFSVAMLAEIRDPNGNRMVFQYDSRGQLFRAIDTLNRPIYFFYNAAGRLAQLVDFTGRAVTFTYDSAGNLVNATSPGVSGLPTCNDFPNGKTTQYAYTSGLPDDRLNHKLVAVTNANEVASAGVASLLANYNTNSADLNAGRVLSMALGGTNATGVGAGGSLSYGYTTLGTAGPNDFTSSVFQTIVTNRDGNVTQYQFNQLGNVNNTIEFARGLRVGDPPAYTNTFAYNSDGEVIVSTNAGLDYVEYVYDKGNPDRFQQGNLLEVHRHRGPRVGNAPELVTTYTYEPNFNHVASSTDPRGHTIYNTYDLAGNLIHKVYPDPAIVEDFEYNPSGQTTAHTLPDNGSGHRRRDVMTYYTSGSAAGYLHQQITDAGSLNLTYTYEYNAAGNVIRTIDPQGNDTTNIVNSLNQIVRTFSPIINTPNGPVRYRRDTLYDANNNVVRVDEENRDESGLIVATNPVLSTSYTYDILNQLVQTVQQVDPTHYITNAYAYDAQGNRTLVQSGEAVAGRQPFNSVQTIYDERRRVFKEIRAPGAPEQSTTQYDYDLEGNLIRMSQGLEDTNGVRVTMYAYDGYNRRISTTDPMGNATVMDYDANGNMTNATVFGELYDVPGSAGNVRLSQTVQTYDVMDRVVRRDVAFFDTVPQAPISDGLATTLTLYTPNSQIFALIDDNTHGTTNLYDSANRLLTKIDAKGNTTYYVYDANNNVVTNIDIDLSDLGNPSQSFTNFNIYDNLHRLIAVIDNLGNTNSSGYDSRNNRTLAVDARGNKTHYAYDGLNRLTQTVRDMTSTGDGTGAPAGAITTQQLWDDSSRVIAQTDDNLNTTRYAYDSLNRCVVTMSPDGAIRRVGSGTVIWNNAANFPDLSGFTNGYDAHGNAIVTTDPNSNTVTSAYDLLNRVTSKAIVHGPGVLGATNETFLYDGLSRLILAQDDISFVARAYDSLGRVIRETNHLSAFTFSVPDQVVIATYDGVGNETLCMYPGGRQVATIYDELNRKRSVSDQNGLIAAYAYVGPTRIERRCYVNAVCTDYTYDLARNPIGVKHWNTNTTLVVDQRAFLRDEDYNKTWSADVRLGGTALTNFYSYDSVNRLIGSVVAGAGGPVRTAAYKLDGVGNRCFASTNTVNTNCDYIANSVNQYTVTPFGTRTYDFSGNLISTTNGPDVATFSYDYRNLIVQVGSVPANNGAFYVYDVLSRRVGKRLGTNAIRFVYDGWQLMEEQDTNGLTVATYTYGNYLDEVLQMQRSGTNVFYHCDELFNVLALTDQSGNVIERYDYQEYGTPSFFTASSLPLTQSIVGNAYLFGGRWFDLESGLYNFRLRSYDDRTGAFLQADPLFHHDGMNDYQYVASNPVNRADPLGLESRALNEFEISGRFMNKNAIASDEILASWLDKFTATCVQGKPVVVTTKPTFFQSVKGVTIHGQDEPTVIQTPSGCVIVEVSRSFFYDGTAPGAGEFVGLIFAGAAVGGTVLAGAGAVAIPVIGAVPGWVVGVSGGAIVGAGGWVTHWALSEGQMSAGGRVRVGICCRGCGAASKPNTTVPIGFFDVQQTGDGYLQGDFNVPRETNQRPLRKVTWSYKTWKSAPRNDTTGLPDQR